MCLSCGNNVVLLHRMIGQSRRGSLFVPFTEMNGTATRIDQEFSIAKLFFSTDLQ